MKTTITLLIGALLSSAITYAFTKDSFYFVKSVDVDKSWNNITKYYDEDNGVSCYIVVLASRATAGISCVK